jgi:type IV secretion system protein VirD4
LLSNSENTLTSIVATMNAPLTIFADAVVDAATAGDDFRLEDLRRQRMSVYVRVPPNRLANARPLLNLFFSQLVSLNTQHLPDQDATLKYQCLLVNDEFAAMGRVGVISQTAAYLAGYNLRLLTVVQAMSQLDAVYGDKEARTFATNHGLQILYAPREQRDADEYSAMLGQFTETATSRGRSRSFSKDSHSSVSRNESDQRRALLLPQEFKELGSERLVVICENCKPILGKKIRYHRDKAFTARLRPAPKVPAMDMDLHIAKVHQRWRYADDELAEGQSFDVNALGQELTLPPDGFEGPPKAIAASMLEQLFAQQAALQNANDTANDAATIDSPAADVTVDETNGASFGGCIAPVANDDGVLLTETHADEADMRSAALTSIEQSQMFAQGRSPCDSV